MIRARRFFLGPIMRNSIAAIVLFLLAVVVPAHVSARADNYPSHPITLIVPYPPGGATDVTARVLAERMGPLLGQPLIIENVGGAGGSLGVGRLARAAPDGYTIDIGQWDTHVGSIIYRLDYDLQTAFAPIGLITINPQLMVARPGLPVDDLRTLAAFMKQHPGDIKFANQFAAAQISGLMLEKLTGSQVLFVPYRGGGPAMTDLIGGHIDLMVTQAAAAMPQMRAGTIKPLANLSPRRSLAVPDIPTSDESGLPGLYMSGWFGFFAPKGTPKPIIDAIDIATIQALADPAVRGRLNELGLDVASREQQTPAGLAAFQKAEIEKWWPIIKEAGIKGE
jgi:tripartite-type tricarboxylate transporter receptor subunit TctC